MSGVILPRILNAEFMTSCFEVKQFPLSEEPEIVFVGRSNVGKSTLLNNLAGKKALARVSKTPGRTQSINFFKADVEYAEKVSMPVHLVDLPGYGYAKVDKDMQSFWKGFLSDYISKRPQIAVIALLVDIRRDIEKEEKQLLTLAGEVPVVLVLTKGDKLTRNQVAKRKALIEKSIARKVFSIVVSSSLAKGETSHTQVLSEILRAFL